MINPLAEVLNIDKSRIYANNLLFDAEGNYAGKWIYCKYEIHW